MDIEATPDNSDQPDKLQAILDLDKDGYFDNITALAATLCSKPFAALLTSLKGRLVCKATYGFSEQDIGLDLSFDTDDILIDDTHKSTFQNFELNGEIVQFLAGAKVAIDADTCPLWLCVMDCQPGSLTAQQLTPLKMLAKQVAGLYKLSAHSLVFNDNNQADQKLHNQKAFYEKILNNIPSDIAVFDANHRYLFVNPGAISIEEYRNFIIGKDDYEYAAYRNRDVSIADKRRAQFLEVKSTGKGVRWSEKMKRPDGTVAAILRHMFPVVEDSGEINLVIGYGIDITDRMALEETQAGLVKQLSLQNTQLIDFCNIVSHNLRAPLVNMSMLVDFIKETNEPEEHQLLIDKLGPVVQNLHGTLNELVESIQIKQNIEIEAESMSLEDVLKRSLKGLESEININSVDIGYNFNDAPEIRFPPKYMHSIFHNFLSNASKYRSPNRRLVIDIGSEKIANRVILHFTDNGQGIDLAKHGDKLFKIGKVFHDHPDAKGFGLYMTKTQVEAMNGRVWVASKPNEGSTFYIEFTNQGL